MDHAGNILIFNPTPAGSYPFVADIGSNPVFTSARRCLPGTYKQCLACSSNSFCPVGAVSDVPLSSLDNIIQVLPYPKSPESIIFDEILLQNMLYIGKGRCLVISPLFWTMIVAVLKICIAHPRAKFLRAKFKWIFRHIDLINEGELWIGGLASMAVIVLVSFAYSFSGQFLKQYPIEETSDSHFACDLSLKDAKFETDLQSLSIQRTESEEKLFELFNHQNLSLNVDFINTLIDCNAVSLQTLFGTT